MKILDNFIDLEKISENLTHMLREHKYYFGREFSYDINKHGILEATPNSVYSAKVAIPVVDDLIMYGIFFAPKDGTGNLSWARDSKYVDIPEKYKFEEKQERVFPRNKIAEKIIFEVMLPIGTIRLDNSIERSISLEQLTLDELSNDDKMILKKDWDVKSNKENTHPQIIPTTWCDLSGRRYGDVHAFYNPTQQYQLVCFLGFNKGQFSRNQTLINKIQPNLDFPNLK